MIQKNSVTTPAFRALLLTLVLGAMNDNIFKLVLSLLVVKQIASSGQGIGHLVLINALFVLPFVLFSGYTGRACDRYSKRAVIVVSKIFEALLMSAALICFLVSSMSGLLIVLFLMGLQSTLFSPAKYGILPELLDSESLSKGNGYVEASTFAAIIAGTAFAGMLLSIGNGSPLFASCFTVLLSAIGIWASLRIPQMPAQAIHLKFELNAFSHVYRDLRSIRDHRGLFLTLIGISFFWFMASIFQLNLLLYAQTALQLGNTGTSLLLTVMAVGIGVGSLIAGYASAGRVELGLVPLGALGIAVTGISLGFSDHLLWLTVLLLFMLGVSSGFFTVPLNAYLQERSPKASRGRFIAATNIISFFSMLLSSAVLYGFSLLPIFSPAVVFIILGVATVFVTIYLVRLLPDLLVRSLNWLFTHTIYRITVHGVENIPERGGALLVCNHVSYMDACLILAAFKRPVRFLMHKPIYENPVIKPFVKAAGAIPIEAGSSRSDVASSLDAATSALAAGEIVCIFAEGSLTRIGILLPFRKGLERIINGRSEPIIPIYLDGMWGSLFSYRGGRFFWKLPRRIPYPVRMMVGKPLASDAKAYDVRNAVQQLSTEAAMLRDENELLLGTAFMRTARRNRFRRCCIDSTGMSLSFGGVLTATLCLRHLLKQVLGGEERVGIFLPSSVGGLLANTALTLLGKTPVNLNYTASNEALQIALSRAEIKSVISSERFLEKLEGYDFSKVKIIDIQKDLLSKASILLKIQSAFLAYCCPLFILQRTHIAQSEAADTTATIIFSSGSTGVPKGVMLSNRNIMSNISSLYDVFQVSQKDTLMGVLPFFHSFGFTVTLWLPLLAGIRVVYHSNPMDAGTVGKMVEREQATLLLATPTFLRAYTRKIKAEQFRTLRIVVVGAEKLSDNIAKAFSKKFALTPLEGYGATELSPVASINVPDILRHGVKQIGTKFGTVGHPIPGVSTRIVDPETFVDVEPRREGLLLVRGPNVMQGYLGEPERTAEVIRDGWYVTGDIAKEDPDGFITITDRLSRFSKIGGEMVPHIKIEEAIHEVLDTSDHVAVVTAVPDGSKSEQLVVLSVQTINVDIVIQGLQEKSLPNLWIPRKDSFYTVDAIPILGSGKVDLKELKSIALKLTGGETLESSE